MQQPLGDPRTPRLRGLDPALLLGVLHDDACESLPQIPGWRIVGVAGEGGSGIVWRAERVGDGVAAAIKIAPPGEPETVERIEREAGFLRELRHPHIVELLETGALEAGEEAGGLYMAMEFIDGPALVHEIPERGLPPEKAFRWFREIASAVAHAHDAGVLHRDLKPANVLVDPDGRVKVADFGLARPVHRRVHLLSLTRAGLVAGTAEYLPPEAYHRDYRSGPAADMFALGVMLHEMLTGTPPRGAWLPTSARKGVDVRIDGIVRRAMDPDPARRWPDARAMVVALDEVLASPPRYAGAPLVTFPVRVADCLWTLAGLFMCVAGLGSMAHLRKSRIDMPLDLVGDYSHLIGGFHALFVLSLVAVPLGLWQLARLWRFRHIPLREALPSPFGLRLGHARTTALLVFFCQFFCLVLPVLHMLGLFLESSLTWLRPGDPPWAHGLAVTDWTSPALVSPWKIGALDAQFWLLENLGIPGHPLAQTIDRIGFNPFFVPAIMVAGAVLAVAALLAAVLTGCWSWWCRKHCCRTTVLAVLSVLGVLLLGHSSARDFRNSETNRTRKSHPDRIASAMTRHINVFAEELLGIRREGAVPNFPGGGLALYFESVDYRSHGLVRRSEIPSIRDAERPRAERVEVRVFEQSASWEPADGSFRLCIRAVELCDGIELSGNSEATALTLELSGTVTAAGHTAIRREWLGRVPLYQAENRLANSSEAGAWAQALRDALASGQALDSLFHPISLGVICKSQQQWYLPGDPHTVSLMALLRSGSLTLVPDGVQVEGRQPGARTRLAIPLQAPDRERDRTLHADLVYLSGNWRCVSLAFGS